MSLRSKSARPRLEVLENRITPATRIWDGGAVSNNWTNANNWGGDVAPVAGDTLVFPSNVSDKTSDNNFPAGTVFAAITLAGGHTLRGARFELGSGGITSSGSSNIIKNDIHLGAFSNTTPRTFLVNTGSTLFIDGEISGGKEVHKTGPGNLSFRANNSYSNTTDVKAGILFVEKDESLGGLNDGTVVRAGATLLFNDTAIGTIRSDEAIIVESGATIRANNDVELRGQITTQGNANVRHIGGTLERLTISGRITGPGGVTVPNDAGRVRMSGTTPNDYAGTTIVTGELQLDKENGPAISGPLTINAGGEVSMRDSLFVTQDQIDDAADVVVNAAGKLSLGSTTFERIGALTLNGGQVDGSLAGLETSQLSVEGLLTATSSSASAPARITNTDISAQPSVDISVLDGPAFNDLVTDDVIFFTTAVSGLVTKTGAGTWFHSSPLGDQNPAVGGDLRFIDVVVAEGLFRSSSLINKFSVTVNAGARYAGDGRIENLTVNTGGRVRPGPLSGTGTLGVQVGLVMNPGSILEVTLNGAVAGTGHDQLDVTGTVLIEPGAILEPTLGPSAVAGQNYRIIENGGTDAIFGEFTAPEFLQPGGQRLLTDYTGGTLDNDLVLQFLNTAPKAPDLALDLQQITEGGTVTATGSLVDPDPGDELRLIVNWGDGSSEETFRPGRDPFTLRHTYLNEGEFRPLFTWRDQNDEGNEQEFAVTVAPAAPDLVGLRADRGRTRVALRGRVSDPGQDGFTVVVRWGDGRVETRRFDAGATGFVLGHRYGGRRRFIARVEVTNEAGDGDTGAVVVPRRA